MNDYISRQAAIDEIKALYEWHEIVTEDRAIDHFKRLPSAQPEQPTVVQDILQYLDEYLHPIVSPEHWSVYSELYDMISMLPSAQQWIPCSERLPEKSGRYLVTNTRLGAFEVTWNIFYNGKGEAHEGWLYEDGTIAWMPLPEPYNGEEE